MYNVVVVSCLQVTESNVGELNDFLLMWWWVKWVITLKLLLKMDPGYDLLNNSVEHQYLQHRGTEPRWGHSQRLSRWRRPNWSPAGQRWEPPPPEEVRPESWRPWGILEVCCSCWHRASRWLIYDFVLSSSAPESDSQPAEERGG